MSNPNVRITGSAYFKNSAVNLGEVDYAKFSDYAINSGTVKEAGFFDSSTNSGTVSAEAHFFNSALNKGTSLTKATFFNSSKNFSGTLYGENYFTDTAENKSLAYNKAQFSLSATNTGTVQGSGIFFGSARNTVSGTVSGFASLESNTNLGTLIGTSAAYVRNGFYESDWGFRYINGTRYDIKGVNGFANEPPVGSPGRIFQVNDINDLPGFNIGGGYFYVNFYLNLYQDSLKYFKITDPSVFTTANTPLVNNQATSFGYLKEGRISYDYDLLTPISTSNRDLICFLNNEDGANLINSLGAGYTTNEKIIITPFFGTYKNGKFIPLKNSFLDKKGRLKVGPYSDYFYLQSTVSNNFYPNNPYTTRLVLSANLIVHSVFKSLDDNKYRVYRNYNNFNNISAIELATGLYDNGYFLSGEFDTTKTSTTPASAINNSKFYTYASGRTTVANGHYSNFKITNGNIDSSYGGYGVALDDSKAYHYTVGIAEYLATGNFTFGRYDLGIFNSSFNSTTPLSALNASPYYTYLNGVATAAAGYYSNGYFVAGTKTSITNKITALDNGYLYSYSGLTVGSPLLSASVYGGKYFYQSAPRTGAFYDGYYLNGYIDTSKNLTELGIYNDAGATAPYVYTSGVAATFSGEFDDRAWVNSVTATGPFKTYYYSYGAKDLTYSNNTPQSGSYVNGYFVYSNGVAASADGPYVSSYFINGIQDYSERTIPLTAIDGGGLYYKYPGSGNSPDLASGEYGGIYYINGFSLLGQSGPYSIGYMLNGAIDDSVSLTNPVSAIDNSLFYTYLSGVPTLAQGPYTNNTGYISGVRANGQYTFGYYAGGSLVADYTNTRPNPNIDEVAGSFYTASSGVFTVYTGTNPYSNYYFVNGMPSNGNYNAAIAVDTGTWYDYDENGSAAEVNFFTIPGGKTYNNVRLRYDNALTGIYVDTSYSTTGLYEQLQFHGNNVENRYVKIENGYSVPIADGEHTLTINGALTAIYAPLLGDSVPTAGTYQIADSSYVNWGPVIPVDGSYPELYYYGTDGANNFGTIRSYLSPLKGSGGYGSNVNGHQTYASFLWANSSNTSSISGAFFLAMDVNGDWDTRPELSDPTPHRYQSARLFVDGQEYGIYNGGALELLYFVVQNGIGVLANGVYTNDYFSLGGIHQNAPTAGYYQTINASNTYRRIFANGDFGIPAAGAYSFGYLNNQGSVNTGYTNETPQVAIDNSNLYTYSNGTSIAFNGGGFFDFKYTNGSIDTEYDSSTPQKRTDVNGYSVYTDGVAGRTATSIYADDGFYKNDNVDLNYSYLAAGDDGMHLSISGSWKVYGTEPGTVSTPVPGTLLPEEYQVDLTAITASGFTVGFYKKAINSTGGVSDDVTPNYLAYGTLLGTSSGNNYFSDGSGDVYLCTVAGNVVNSGSYQFQIGTETYTIGTWEEVTNGSCGTSINDTWNYEVDTLIATIDNSDGTFTNYFASHGSPYYYTTTS